MASSHLHFDHTGNANLFGTSVWILNKTELAWAQSDPTPSGIDPASFRAYKMAKKQMIDGDYDLFGDGTDKILRAPGHTPGYQVLEVDLRKSGTIILSGDLYHTRENRRTRRRLAINGSRADSLASIDRIERIVALKKARVVIQHDPEDFKAMPRFPAWLE
jgi:N-acyl homoserine lactone hydrolase